MHLTLLTVGSWFADRSGRRQSEGRRQHWDGVPAPCRTAEARSQAHLMHEAAELSAVIDTKGAATQVSQIMYSPADRQPPLAGRLHWGPTLSFL